MNLMSETTKTMKDLLSKEEFFLPKPGSLLNGEVISVSRGNVFVDLGSIGIGIVYPGEFYDNPDRMKTLKPGDSVSAMLLELENDDGYRELSLKAAQMTTAWQDIKEKKEKGEVITTRIININKGGLIVEVSGVQGFLPLSQLSAEHYPKVEGGDTTKIVQALQKFKGQDFQVKILDFNETENKLIVSEKAIQEEVAKEEMAKLKVGDIVEGDITEVTDFGAFVKLSDMLDGLIHSSEIDWKFIEDPREILTPGDKVRAKIVSLEGGRISLSLKALKDDPWLKIETLYQPEQTVRGKVTKIRNNGAFVELPGDPEGDPSEPYGAGIIAFLPASSEPRPELKQDELSSESNEQSPVHPPVSGLEIGKEYDFTITSIDIKEHKMVLALKKSAE